MEQLSIKIANILLRNKYIEEAMYSVYQYGIQMAFEVGCSFIMSIIICCACGQMIDGIIFFWSIYTIKVILGWISYE